MYCKVKGNTPLFVVLSSKELQWLFVRDMPFQNLKNSLNCYQTLGFVVMYSSFLHYTISYNEYNQGFRLGMKLISRLSNLMSLIIF